MLCCLKPGCGRPRHVHAATGIVHDYCGRTHAQEHLGAANVRAPHGICHSCALPGCSRPVFYDADEDRVHDYCSWSCAQDGYTQANTRRNRKRSRAESVPVGNCSYPGCERPRWVDEATHVTHDFCGRSCAKRARKEGLEPVAEDDSEHVEKVWRGRDGEPAYRIALLKQSHRKFDSVQEQFLQSWQHTAEKPTLVSIMQVRNTKLIFDEYKKYGARLDELANSRTANEQRRFHGTSLAAGCKFGIDPEQRPCTEASCALCNICASGFDLGRAGSGPNRSVRSLRYGEGLYFSKIASKSDTYANGSEREEKDRAYRMIFLCKVSLGDSFDTKEEQLTADQLDKVVAVRAQGGDKDSITGLSTADGGKLNFEENVVYTSKAAIPSYLIVYNPPRSSAPPQQVI